MAILHTLYINPLFEGKKYEAYSEDIEPLGGNLCLLDWSFAGCYRSSNPHMVGKSKPTIMSSPFGFT